MSKALLIDANLSWRLVRLLENEFPGIKHVSKAGLVGETPSTKIWEYAKNNDYGVITNDEDFYLLSLAKGFPPKIVLLRTGNQSTKYIAAVLSKHKAEILHFLTNSEYGIFEIF